MATLQLLTEEDPYPLELSQTGIGRANDNEISIDDDSVSAFHALVSVVPGSSSDEADNEYIIEDLDSTNSTYVNGKAISKRTLKNGDIIRVGQSRLKFSSKEYVLPQQDFQKTTKLNKTTLRKYLGKK